MLFLQVVMGYSHSLVIARQDTEPEQEKLKKLPEYNPRTIWLDHQQQHLNLFHWSGDQRSPNLFSHCRSQWCSSGMVEFRGRCSQVRRITTHLNYQQTGFTSIWTLKSEKMGLEIDRSSGWSSSHNEQSICSLTNSSEPATVCSEYLTPSSYASQKPFSIL